MSRADELNAAFGDGASSLCFEFRADLVDDDDFGHVIFDRFDHHRVLERGGGHLHPACAADRGVRDVAVAGDFVGRVDDDDAFAGVIGKDASDFAEHGGLADAGATEEEDALAAGNEVFDDADGAVDGAAHAAGEADDLAAAVADAGDAMERPFDAGAVVVSEGADVGDDVLEVLRAISRSSRTASPPPPKRASGLRPRSITTSMTEPTCGSARMRSPISGGSA